MAQIKKFQNPAGPIEETAKKKYGKIHKNGTPYEVTDDTLGWLRSQGGIGIEIANKLENGTDQYITVGADGVGTIHNMSMPDSELNYRQKRRLTRKQGILGGLFESGAVDSAREYIQRISDQNYQSFIKDPEKYDLPKLELDYNVVKNEDGSLTYSFSKYNDNNRKAVLRLEELKQKGFIIPEGKEWKGDADLSIMQNYAKQMPEGLVDRVKTHSLTEDDKDFLQIFNIIYKAKEKTDKGESIAKITEEKENYDERMSTIGTYIASLGLDPSDNGVKELFGKINVSSDGTVTFPKEWETILGNGYVFTKNDTDFAPLSGYIYIDGEIKKFNDVINNPNVAKFIEYYNRGDYANAKKLFGFKLPNIYSENPSWLTYDGTNNTWLENGLAPNTRYYLSNDGNTAYYLFNDPEFHNSLYNFGQYNKPEIKTNQSDVVGTHTPVKTWDAENYEIGKDAQNNPITVEYAASIPVNIRGKRNPWYVFLHKGQMYTVESVGKNGAKLIHVANTKNWTNAKITEFVSWLKQNGLNMDAANSSSNAYEQINNLAKTYSQNMSKHRNGGTVQKIKKFQTGSIYDLDPKTFDGSNAGPTRLADLKNGNLDSYDIADLVSLGADISSYITAFGKNKKALYTSLGLDALSTLAYLYANSRDGLGWNDVGNAALNLGLTGLQYTSLEARKSKVLNTFNKISRWVQPLLFGFGLNNGYQGLSNIIEKIKDDRVDEITKAEVDAVYQGIKAIIGIGQNISDVRVRNKYLTKAEAQKIEANKIDPLAKVSDKYKPVVKKYVVDTFLKQNNNEPGFITGADGSKYPTKWFDAETGTVKPGMYDEAYAGLREGLGGTSFTPDVIRKLSLETPDLPTINKTAIKAEKAKETGKSFAQKGKDAVQSGLEVAFWGINPDKYILDMSKIEDATKLAGPTVRSLERFYYANPENYVEVPEILKVRTNAKQPKIMPTEQPKPAPEVPKQQVETAVEPQVPVSKTTVSEPIPPTTPVQQQTAVQQSLFDQNKSPLSLDAIFPFRHANNYELKLPVKVSINTPELTPRHIGTSIKGEPVYHYDLKLGNTVIATYDQFGDLKTQISPRDLSQIEIKRSGGRIQKAWGGAAILDMYHKDFDASKLTAEDKTHLERYGKEGTHKYNLYGNLLYNTNLSTKDKRALQAAIGKAEFNSDGNLNYDINGPQKKKNDVNLFGVLSPFTELAVSEAGNKKVLDTTTEAIRKGSIGAMKSMPIKQYRMDYSALHPLITEYNNQAAELWNHTSEVNKGLADSRLRIANNSNTASNIIKNAQTLSTQMGKHISDVDAQNLKLGLNYLEGERQIADYNNNIAGTTAANILSKKAETIGKTFNNYTKTMAEFREDQDKYNAAKRTQGLYAALNQLSKQYTTASDEEKKSILARMNAIRELIGHAGIYSRFTGKYALDTTWKS